MCHVIIELNLMVKKIAKITFYFLFTIFFPETPTLPKVFLNGVEISQITFPFSIGEDFVLTCSSYLGSPRTNLTWELDGIRQDGIEDISSEINLHNVTLTWDQPPESLENKKSLKCVATHPGFQNDQSYTVQITRES